MFLPGISRVPIIVPNIPLDSWLEKYISVRGTFAVSLYCWLYKSNSYGFLVRLSVCFSIFMISCLFIIIIIIYLQQLIVNFLVFLLPDSYRGSKCPVPL